MTIDTVYMVCYPGNRGVFYGAAGRTAREAWSAFEELELGGTGARAGDFRSRGYRARKVRIELEEV